MPRAASIKATGRISSYFNPVACAKSNGTTALPATAASSPSPSASSSTATAVTIRKRRVKSATLKPETDTSAGLKASGLISPTKLPAKLPRVIRPSDVNMAELKPVKDVLLPGLDVLFVGINPGIQSSLYQHHFANPLNLFWRGLYHCRLVPEPLTAHEEDKLVEVYNMSITNLVDRPTRTTSDLSRKEMKEAVPRLTKRIDFCRPKIVCFVGMGIYEVYAGKPKFPLGLQPDVLEFPQSVHDESLPTKVWVFVMPSTSGRTAAYQNPQKLELFCQLKRVYDKVMAGESPADLVATLPS
ncbi:uracil DNA N-glycosylase Thp1 [Spiromyces aspiralis]|uniref:Uracil DNA N-glycosylase Thp1 n=1 Tax=Spiromyces aspiralis TaxID=68401 RepID=A0ACC1HQ51_9FUNG|nr:uracil DNA N-glycosylase Thp1 [Spiromyces aspiralis]